MNFWNEVIIVRYSEDSLLSDAGKIGHQGEPLHHYHSCGKLTTGVTVPEWTAVMMLTGSASTAASGCMQTIFRVQSAGVLDGKQKERCHVFDLPRTVP